MLPFLLHFGVHHQQRVMGQMDGYLTLGVRILSRLLVIFGYDAADTELACDAEREGAYDSPGAQIRQLV